MAQCSITAQACGCVPETGLEQVMTAVVTADQRVACDHLGTAFEQSNVRPKPSHQQAWESEFQRAPIAQEALGQHCPAAHMQVGRRHIT